MPFRGFFIRKQRKLKSEDFSFLVVMRFDGICFLLKKAIAVPIQKSEKERQCFLNGNLLSRFLFYCEGKGFVV